MRRVTGVFFVALVKGTASRMERKLTTAVKAPSEVSVQDALDLLEAAVQERGADYVGSCAYLDYENSSLAEAPVGPSCIAGHVFVAAGVPMAAITPLEGRTADVVARHLGFSGDVAEVLKVAQKRQDRGSPWGEALEAARWYANEWALA